MPDAAVLERLWGPGPVGALGRLVLAPFEVAWRGGVWWRNRRYDAGHDVVRPAIPALSVGNITVGGTGKTPVSSWLAERLRAAGARPGLVLRGYGADEAEVHRVLTPAIPVLVNPDRVAAAVQARAAGCDVVVLDDAFQHRRIARVADFVLVSADATWSDHVLPAGPLREPWSGIARADLAMVTVKAAGAERVRWVRDRLRSAGARAIATLHLHPDRLVRMGDGQSDTLERLRGRRVLAIGGIGNPLAFFQQLRDCGGIVTGASWPDHHRYRHADVEGLVRRGEAVDVVVCTLKDAVKLRNVWPEPGPELWYVSQRVELVDPEHVLDEALQKVLAARSHEPL